MLLLVVYTVVWLIYNVGYTSLRDHNIRTNMFSSPYDPPISMGMLQPMEISLCFVNVYT